MIKYRDRFSLIKIFFISFIYFFFLFFYNIFNTIQLIIKVLLIRNRNFNKFNSIKIYYSKLLYFDISVILNLIII